MIAFKMLLAMQSVLMGAEAVGKRVEPFRLQDQRGAWHSLEDYRDQKAVVVLFLGIECPLAKLYAPRVESIMQKYHGKGVAFLAIDSNRQDSVTEINHFVRLHEITYPILKDLGNVVADQFEAERTPEVFVLDQAGVIRYHGRVDDQYGVGYIRPEATNNNLADALDAILAGQSVSVAETPAPGCFIGRAKEPNSKSEVTYSDQIARIFQSRCVECHREGQIAPFALTNYEESAGWADTIAEVVRDQRMPPWHASPEHGDFANDCRLTDEQKEQIFAWAEAGAPEGDPADLPEPVAYAEGWRLAQADLVLEMKDEFDVPAEGEIPYQYFVMDPQLTEDKWVEAAECLAGNPTVVHHIIAFVVPPPAADLLEVGHFAVERPPVEKFRGAPNDSGRKQTTQRIANKDLGAKDVDADSRIAIMRSWFTNFLTAMVPGAPPASFGDGFAKRIPAGSKIVFQTHYTPTGRPQKDRSRIALDYIDEKDVVREVVTRNVMQQRFEIPPYASNHEVNGTLRFREDTLLIDVAPHMHLRGKSFKYTVIYPDGRREVVLDVPRYDFGWQNIYTYRKPLLLPRGTVMECVAHFDNSEDNLSNPDPSASVHFGDQTWEEMMIGFFDMAHAKEGPYRDLKHSRAELFLASAKNDEIKLDANIRERAMNALRSDEDFDLFWDEVATLVPQLDRADVGVADGFSFRFGYIQQAEEIPSTFKMKEFPKQLAALGPALGLYQFAIGRKLVVNQDPSAVKGVEMQFMARIMPSSVHVPIRFEGKPATVNFWSSDENAFPPESVALLEELVELMKPAEAQARASK